MKVLGMSSGLNEFHDFANVNIGVHGLSLRERHLRREAEIANGISGLERRRPRLRPMVSPPQPRAAALHQDLPGLASTKQIERSDNQCGHQQQMDQSTRHVKPPAQKPEDDQNGNHGPKHRLTVQGRNPACQAVRSCRSKQSCLVRKHCGAKARFKNVLSVAGPLFCSMTT